MTRREEILRAISAAATVHAESPTRARTSFDVIGAVAERNIPLLFRPLDKLWGAFISVNDQERGIVVTTKLGLPVQRFTVAHELGHLMLGHRMSLDKTIDFAGRHAPASRPQQEVAADTFAAELLAPKNLLVASARRHGWTRDKLHQPGNIYQLSLRLGISYQAACWGLATCKVLTRPEADRLRTSTVKELKRALAPAALIANPWADVWALTAADSDTFLEAGPDDLFAVRVDDHASAGYVWRLADANADTEVVEEQASELDQAYGARSARVLYLRFRTPGVHHLVLEHVRPWSRATLARIQIDIDGHGKECQGWARRTRTEALGHVA
ncbi:MAG: ImmA/IrrE family metallo-endopeptidase [Acidobacteria bacterium]|nr:ImmA/IrrE family metallo-endopeptidase [Acidobacteriota bacterium]